MAATTNPYGSTSVEERVADISKTDSALNQMARTEAAKVMNRRGMLNSAMTVGAAQDAVIKNATPIASQDAAQAFTGAESALDRTAAEKAQTADIANQQKMQQTQITADVAKQTADIDAQKAMQATDIASKEKMQGIDIASAEKVASWNLSSADRNAAAQLLTNMETMYQTQYDSIMSNEYLDASTRETYLAAADSMREGLLYLVEQMYNIDLYY